MKRSAILSFIFVAFIVVLQATPLSRLEINQGLIRIPNNLANERSLETSKLASYDLTRDGYTFPTVAANLGETFIADNKLEANEVLPLFVFLFTSDSCLSKNWNYFKDYECNPNYCTENTASTKTWASPYFRLSGNYITSVKPSLAINAADGTSQPWKLMGEALYIKSMSGAFNEVSYNHLKISANIKKTYGWIGLGIEGDAAKNFQTEEPIVFSIKMDGVGKGNIYFGDNTALIDSKINPQTLVTDGNWQMTSRNLSLGQTTISTTYASAVIFDHNFDGIGIPASFWDQENGLKTLLTDTYHLVIDSSAGTTTDSEYAHTFTGDLASLPDIVIGLGNDKNLIIPSSVYMELVPEKTNVYICRLVKVKSAKDAAGENKEYTILGVPILKNYAVFRKPKDSSPQVTLYIPGVAKAASSHLWYYIIGGVAVILVLLGIIVLKGKGSSGALSVAKPSSGLELR